MHKISIDGNLILFNPRYEFKYSSISANNSLSIEEIVAIDLESYKMKISIKSKEIIFIDRAYHDNLLSFVEKNNLKTFCFFDAFSELARLLFIEENEVYNLAMERLIKVGFSIDEIQSMKEEFHAHLKKTDAYGETDVYHFLKSYTLLSKKVYDEVMRISIVANMNMS